MDALARFAKPRATLPLLSCLATSRVHPQLNSTRYGVYHLLNIERVLFWHETSELIMYDFTCENIKFSWQRYVLREISNLEKINQSKTHDCKRINTYDIKR